MIKKEVIDQLDAKIPRDCIAQRDGGGPKKLSYLEGWYVIDRLNKVLGQGNWAYETEEMRLVHSGDVGGKQVAHYVAKVRLNVYPPGEAKEYREYVTFSDFGYGDGSDKYNPGKAHELAVKEAVTDGIKRCAKNLGMSLGLALYDKTQENVDDGESNTPARGSEPGRGAAAVGGKQASPQAAPVEAKSGGSRETVSPTPPADRKAVNELIVEMAKVIVSKKAKTMDEIRADMRSRYQKEKKEDLTDAQASEFYGVLRGVLYA